MANTTNLNLYVTNDSTVKMKDWIAQMAAPTDSNMTKIDAAYKTLSDNMDAATINIGKKQDKHSAVTGTLTVAGWTQSSGTYTQTITVTGVTASNTVIISPAASQITDYIDAEIVCTAQASNSLTFVCSTPPMSAITVNVVILGV